MGTRFHFYECIIYNLVNLYWFSFQPRWFFSEFERSCGYIRFAYDRVSDPVWYWPYPDPDPTSQDKPNPDPKPCATVYHSFILSRLFTILLTNMDLYLDGKQPCCEYVCQAKNELYLLAISLLFIKLSSWCKFVCKIWDSGIREI